MLSAPDRRRSSSHCRRKPGTPKECQQLRPFKLDLSSFEIFFHKRSRAIFKKEDPETCIKTTQSRVPSLDKGLGQGGNGLRKALTFSSTARPVAWNDRRGHNLSTTATKQMPKLSSTSLGQGDSCLRLSRKTHEEIDESDFMCAICLEILYRPRQLTCGHAFCLTCLQSYSNTCSHKITCPSCRQPSAQRAKGVSDIPRNVLLEKAADDLRARRKSMAQRGKICLLCHSETDVKECRHCNKGWCSVCYVPHLREVKEEVQRLRRYLEESRERLICKREEEETRLNKLEERIREAIDIRKEDLFLKVQKLREESQEKIQNISQEMKKTENNLLGDDQRDETSWDETWRQCNEISQLLTSLSSSMEQRVTFDESSLTLSNLKDSSDRILRRVSSIGSEDQDDEEEERFIIPVDHGALYRKKSGSPKYRWGHNICSRPAGVAVSPWTGNIFVTASDSCRVHIFSQNGKQINSFGTRGHREGNFMCPIGIAFNVLNKEVYITDKWKHCIHVFSPDGSFLRQIGKKGTGLGEFSSPEGVASDSRGNIYVADVCNDRVQILDSDGVFEGEVGLISSEMLGHGRRYTKREFNEPVGVAVSADGSKIYVADSGNHRIRVYDNETGERLLMFGSRGRNKGQFESPESVAVDHQGYILVGDSGNGRIQLFQPNGRFVRTFGSKSNRRGEFGWVSGLALTKQSELIVTDFKNNTIAAF